MRFGVLGPLALWGDAGPVSVRGHKPRAVLALLLLNANRTVSTDRLLDGVWGDEGGERLPSLHVYVSTLRRLLETRCQAPGALVTAPPGYRLDVGPDDLDSARFERLAGQGRAALAAGSPEQARARLSEALALWRGPALEDLADEPFARPEVARLEDLRVAALEDRIEADLALGRHAELASELDGLVEAHPVRERLWAQLMIALYRAGRQADALRTYGRARSLLVEEYGIDPGPVLRELERSVLAQDPLLAAPAVAAPAAPVVALPWALTPLLGRAGEVEAVVARLREPQLRLLTLTGPGGTGKTRLAVEVAWRLADEYAGAVWFVRLDALADAALVPSAVAKALGGDDGAAADATDIAAAVGARPGLLVLDNFEHVLAAAPEIATLLAAAPQLRVLVTSRAPLRVSGEHEHPLAPLGLPDPDDLPVTAADAGRYGAVELFLARARAARPDLGLDPDALQTVSEICLRLDGLPLALELAAARLKLLSPAMLLARLERSLELLTGGARDLPDRQRTLRGTLRWSYDLLPREERVVLGRLSVFVGGFDLSAAEEVCGDGGLEVFDAVAGLVDSSLVLTAPGGVRFRMLETVRAFGLECLAAAGDAELIRQRHLEHTVRIVEDACATIDGPDGLVRLGLLEAELANVRAAFEFAVAGGDVLQGARLAVALRPAWQASGRLVEGLGWLDTVLRSAVLPPGLRADASVAAGVLTYYRHAWEDAGNRLQGGLDLARTTGSTASEALALCLLGALAAVQGDPAGGQRLALRSLELTAGRPGLYEARVTALSALALCAAVTGDVAAETARYEERLALVRQHGDRLRTANTLNDLAEVALAAGDPARARLRGAEALQSARGYGAVQTRDTLVTLGRVALVDGDPAAAIPLLDEAVSLSVTMRQDFGLAQSLRALAAAAESEHDAERAAVLFGAAERLHPTLRGDNGAFERDIDDALTRAREALGPAAFTRAWARGESLDPDAVVVEALGASAAARVLRG